MPGEAGSNRANIALEDVEVEYAMLRTPDGQGELELVKFHSPPTQTGDPQVPANTPGLRHLAFLVDDIHARGHHRRAGREDRLKRITNMRRSPGLRLEEHDGLAWATG